MRRISLVLLTATAAAVAAPASAQFRCGLTEELQPGETLQELAARCDTEAEEILRVNDAATAAELPEGRLKMPVVDEDEVGDFLNSARNAVRSAGERVEDAARDAGQSISDYLGERPDLNRDIAEFGERIGLPGFSAEPSRGPEVSAQRASDGLVAVEASGLPGGREVNIALLLDGRMEVLKTAETDSRGRLSAEVAVPADAATAGEAVVVVETADERIRIVSDKVALD